MLLSRWPLAALTLAACASPRLDFPTCTDVGTDRVFDTTPTWADDVGPIVQARCATCHQPGGIGPMSLVDPADAITWATAMRDAVVSRQMPPAGPTSCGECNRYTNARWLEPEEIAKVRAWADGGTPLGDGAAPVVPPTPDTLDRADVTVVMDEPYTPDAAGDDDYRCFVIDPHTTADGFITGWEVRPGDARTVHHVLLYGLAAGTELAAQALDAASPGPGYTCFGGPGVDGSVAAGWAPGVGATRLPAGTGLRLPAGGSFVMQVHYNLENGALPDQTTVALRVEPEVNVEGQFVAYTKPWFKLAPGQASVTVEQEFPVLYPPYPGKVTLWGVLPHMHTLGTALTAELWNRDGQTCVTDASPWDFHSQGIYLYEEPIVAFGSDHMRLSCTYDTRSRAEPTVTGEGTRDEMCVMYLYGTPGGPEAALGR